MKTAIVLVAFVAVLGTTFAKPEHNLQLAAVPYEQRIFEDVINATFNAAIRMIAPFDPVSIEHQQADLLGHSGEVTNVNVAGFSNIVASEISLSGLITWTLKLVIDVPRITGSVEHWKVDGGLIYGEGDGSFEMNDFKLTITGKINPLSVSLKELHITPSIGHAHVSINGLFNDEELSLQVSDYINHLLNDVVNNSEWLHDTISTIAFEIVEKILGSILG